MFPFSGLVAQTVFSGWDPSDMEVVTKPPPETGETVLASFLSAYPRVWAGWTVCGVAGHSHQEGQERRRALAGATPRAPWMCGGLCSITY